MNGTAAMTDCTEPPKYQLKRNEIVMVCGTPAAVACGELVSRYDMRSSRESKWWGTSFLFVSAGRHDGVQGFHPTSTTCPAASMWRVTRHERQRDRTEDTFLLYAQTGVHNIVATQALPNGRRIVAWSNETCGVYLPTLLGLAKLSHLLPRFFQTKNGIFPPSYLPRRTSS